MAKGNRKVPINARKRIQGVRITGVPPTGMKVAVGLVFAEGTAIPDSLQQVSSATYSLGSPPISNLQRVAVMSFSLGSPNIPAGAQRLAIFPDA